MMLILTLITLLLGLPIVLYVLRLYVKQHQAKLEGWKDIDPAILKVGGSQKKLEAAADADAVIIGSGLGGLTCAAILSKVGYKVVVLEQHDVIGGATHTFDDKGFEFDVGIHYIGGELDRWASPVRRLWSAVSDDKLEWTPNDPTFDVCHNAQTGESIPFTGNEAENDRAILKHMGNSSGCQAALRAYRRLERLGWALGSLMVVFKALPPIALRLAWPVFAPLWKRFGARSVAETCEVGCGMTGNLAQLGGIVSYLYGDYGANPRRAPWFLHAFVATHYQGGAFFPTGGSASIAKTLVAALVRRGGAAFVRAPVSEILVEGGRAVGVVARGVTLRARVAVISDAGFRNTFGSADAERAELQGAPLAATTTRAPLLPVEVGAPQRALLQAAAAGAAAGGAPRDRVGGSIAMVYLFVGLDQSDEALGLRAQNVWRLRDFDPDAAFDHFEALELPDDGSILPRLDELPAVFVGAASAKDSDWPRRHPGKAAVTVLAPVKAEWFDKWAGGKIKARGAEYDKAKAGWRALLLAALYEHFPQCEGHVAYVDVGTPLSNDFYLGSVHGEVYGLEHTTERYSRLDAQLALHPQSSVRGLYLTGQDSLFVGVVSALMSGVLTATRVSHAAALRFALDFVLA